MYLRDENRILAAYEIAKKTYSAFGVDTDAVIEAFSEIPISLHCW